jgi:hypothetical protein
MIVPIFVWVIPHFGVVFHFFVCLRCSKRMLFNCYSHLQLEVYKDSWEVHNVPCLVISPGFHHLVLHFFDPMARNNNQTRASFPILFATLKIALNSGTHSVGANKRQFWGILETSQRCRLPIYRTAKVGCLPSPACLFILYAFPWLVGCWLY